VTSPNCASATIVKVLFHKTFIVYSMLNDIEYVLIIWSADEYYYKCDQILEIPVWMPVELPSLGSCYLEVSCNSRHWEWLDAIKNYIFIIKLLIWSLNILGVKCTHMGDFHN